MSGVIFGPSADWVVRWAKREEYVRVTADDGCAGDARLDKLEAVALRDAIARAIEEVWGAS